MLNEDEKLTFDLTNGVGRLCCSVCDHEERILSFTHGVSHQLGFQCSTCLQFVALENGLEGPIPPCGCGGELTRDHPLKCPKCKSTNVTFESEYMT